MRVLLFTIAIAACAIPPKHFVDDAVDAGDPSSADAPGGGDGPPVADGGAVCGDNMVYVGEACDDGNQSGGDGCSADCLSKEICGNGIVDSSAGEICDDGNTADGDTCSADCRSSPACGNSLIDIGEDCDDGDTIDTGNGCSGTCHRNSTCGDSTVAVLFEQCDLGSENGLPNKCCDATCSFQPGHTSCP